MDEQTPPQCIRDPKEPPEAERRRRGATLQAFESSVTMTDG